MKQIEKRLQQLERSAPTEPHSGYVAVQCEDDLPEALAQYRGPLPVKVYIGISPDEWDEEP